MADKIIYIGFSPEDIPEALGKNMELMAADHGFELVVSSDQAEFDKVAEQVEIAIGGVPRKHLLLAPRLRWFQQFGTGMDWLISENEIRNSDITITNISDNHYNSLAEHMMALLLAIVRQLHHSIRAQSNHRWHRSEKGRPVELCDMTLLLLGTGSIGKRVAELAGAFGMRVIGVRRNPDRADIGITRCVASADLLDVLPEADIVANSLPLTPDTRHMVNDSAFKAMKRSAIFLNVGRGGTVNEQDLIAALQNGEIGAAGLDVFETEPLPSDSPLWDMENVIISGHFAGSSNSITTRRFEVVEDNLRRFLNGDPLRNVVDKQQCY
jgi:phosphoglycerate dehydrogenase-like enzyme